MADLPDMPDMHAPPPDAPDDADIYARLGISEPNAPASSGEGIIPLGIDRGRYFYLSLSTGQVEEIAAAGHTRGMLTHLASEAYYWQRQPDLLTPSGVNWNQAADRLRRQCRDVGIFDPDRLRGRGAWLDDGRWVLHVGGRLIVDGEPSPLMLSASRHIYEQEREMPIELSDPLGNEASDRLRKLCCMLPFDQPEFMGQLLAGWLVIAPVCGAMTWRPHMWLTGEAGGGKDWVIDNIVKPLIGFIAVSVQGVTTEAGIRQLLGRDGRPVIFNEAETQTEQDRHRMQAVLNLARQASSEDGADIVKGSATGQAMRYRIRSAFFFSSINLGLSQAADESRTVALNLDNKLEAAAKADAFAKLKAQHAATMIPGFSAGLLSRTLRLLPVIRQNGVTFAEAIARAGNSRRLGDTYGVLMAGAWSLRSRAIVTPEQADDAVRNVQWVKEAVSRTTVEPEWQRALSHLYQHKERVTSDNRGTQEIPIGELLQTVAHHNGDVSPRVAEQHLARMLIKVEYTKAGQHRLRIGVRSTTVTAIFRSTPWEAAWQATLHRTPGAEPKNTTCRFVGAPLPLQALSLPFVSENQE